MRIFTRRHLPAWRPSAAHGQQVIGRKVTGLDGSDAVIGSRALGVQFLNSSAPQASITVWVFPIHNDDPAFPYDIGYRIEYEDQWVGMRGSEVSYLDRSDGEPCMTLDICQQACAEEARTISRTPDRAWLYLGDHLAWDGDIRSLDAS